MTTESHENVVVFFENRFVPLAEARINVLTHALHYGTGVFEGIRGYWSDKKQELMLFRPEDHYRRWRTNCRILGIDLPMTPAELAEITADLVRHNGFTTNVYVRPIAWRSAARIGVHADDQYSFAIIAIPFGDYLDSRHGLHAGVSSWRRVEDNAIPGRGKICGAYVNSALASSEARMNGYDEAIFLNESGHVCEGATCNIFLVRQGKLITPCASENILEGITRESIIELAQRELHLEVVERLIDRTELYVADEAFFTGTAVEVAPIIRVDHRVVGYGAVGLVTGELRKLYGEAVRGETPAYRHWLYPEYQPVVVGV
jgi:branched-chain amino acid aminotransferase